MVIDVLHYIMQVICPSIDKHASGSLFDNPLFFASRRPGRARYRFRRRKLVCNRGLAVRRRDVDRTASPSASLALPPSFSPTVDGNPHPRLLEHPLASVLSTSCGRFRDPSWCHAPGTGAIMGAFAVSAFIHYPQRRGLLPPHRGAVMEGAFQRATWLHVRGWFGWLWTMSWTLVWGTLLIDGCPGPA
jgi:hypothetical protein